MENIKRLIELKGSQLLGLYREIKDQVNPNSRCDTPCLRKFFETLEDTVNEYKESIFDDVMEFLEDHLEEISNAISVGYPNSGFQRDWERVKELLQPLA